MTALTSFSIYLLLVFFLAWWSSRIRARKEFVDEYYLGSRNLGVWAFALTFAATNASGGSFMGFPALIYTHGWVLALWIAGYMAVPLVTTGLLAKRLNQVARTAGALTIPELLRERFRSPMVGIVATGMLTLFMFFYLLAQFKAGANILATILDDVPAFQAAVGYFALWQAKLPFLSGAQPDYLICLLVFGVVVVLYTAYGGFRAVVWTDVLQGLVMVFGVGIMLVLILNEVGSLSDATRRLARHTPPDFGQARFATTLPTNQELILAKGTWLHVPSVEEGGENELVRLAERVLFPANAEIGDSVAAEVLIVTTQETRDQVTPLPLPPALTVSIESRKPYQYGAGSQGVYVSAPGPDVANELGFLSMGMAFGFFVFWCFGGAGQPGNMVRQMAFKDSLTLKRSIAMVCVYYSAIYFPLVIIFCCARLVVPGMEIEPDRVMPETAAHLTENAGLPWLTGLIIAAPFAAVMSSVDSFLLIVSSGIVRDIYQRNIHPQASEARLRNLSYRVTGLVGLAAIVAMIHPPQYLQNLSVFASGGLAASFLIPVALTLYWKRMTRQGVIAGMVGGAGTHLMLYIIGYLAEGRFAIYQFLGVQPFIWDLVGSILCAVVVSKATKPPSDAIMERYF